MSDDPAWLDDATKVLAKARHDRYVAGFQPKQSTPIFDWDCLSPTYQAALRQETSAVLAFVARQPREITDDDIDVAAIVVLNHGLGWQVALMRLVLEAVEKAKLA